MQAQERGPLLELVQAHHPPVLPGLELPELSEQVLRALLEPGLLRSVQGWLQARLEPRPPPSGRA